MKTTILSDNTTFHRQNVATIGFFDGVHRGHQFLLRHVVEMARKCGMNSMAITFDKHPRQVLNADYQPQLLSTLEDKLQLLSTTNIDNCVVLPFSKDMAALSAFDFMDTILKRKLNVAKLIIGYDNRFGHNRNETFDDYVEYGRQLDIDVIQNTALDIDGLKVSSSVVRRLLSEGNAGKAACCLGRPYQLHGVVTSGYHEGSKIGFPTANVDLQDSHLLVPANGAYAVRVWLDGDKESRVGMLNIGVRPTFGGSAVSIEVNIFDFSGDLYGKPIRVELCQRLRSERKFEDVGQLVDQLNRDKQETYKIFGL